MPCPPTAGDSRTMTFAVQDHAIPRAGRPEQTRDAEVRCHLVAAVVCALVCFAPLGVAAVVYAGNVRTRLAMGDLEGARRASRTARRLCWASLATTLAFLLVVVVGSAGYSDLH
jgi:hypothetical protein